MVSSQQQKIDNGMQLEFIEKISYEFKDSLTAIIGFSQIVGKSSLDSKQLEHITNILNSSQKLLSFVNNMSDVSKMMSGRQELNSLYVFSPKKLLQEVLLTFDSLILKKKLTVQFDIVEIPLKNDIQAVSKVFYALINHLLKFAPENAVLTLKNQQINGEFVFEASINADCSKEVSYQNLSELLSNGNNQCLQLDLFLVNQLINKIGGIVLLGQKDCNSLSMKFSILNYLEN